MGTFAWAQRRVLVTGGAGFVGSFLVDELRRRGGTQIFIPRSRDYDLTDRQACRRVLADSRPDLVFHLAARIGGIGANRTSPGQMVFDNAMMGLQMLEEIRLAGVPKTVITGSVCAYPKFTAVPFREETLWDGYPEETNAPYGVAKRLLLVQSQAYRRQYGVNSVVLLPVNIYGPRDHFDLQASHVVPALIRKCVAAKEQGAEEVVLWGDGSATREFLYAADAAEALVTAAECYDSSEPINIGSGHEITIRDLAIEIARLTGFSGRFAWDTSQPNGQPRRRLELSKAREHFGFVATTQLEDGLRATIAWYLANRDASERAA